LLVIDIDTAVTLLLIYCDF